MNKNILFADHHCHISKEYFDNPIAEITNLKQDSVEYICIMGVSFENDVENLRYKKEFNDDFLKIGVGLHPSNVIELGQFSNQEFDRIKALILANQDLIDYIGEIGIDFTYPNAEDFRAEQIEIFRQFCVLGKQLNKPVSVHARGAMSEVMAVVAEVFDDSKFNGYIHCFTGNCEEAKYFLNHGMKLGIGGIITFKKTEDLRNVVRNLIKSNPEKHLDELIGLETDTPYLTPEPKRNETNSPRNIKLIADFITANLV